MSTTSTIDLSSLPAPGVIEELDFEVILRAMRDDLVARFPPIVPVIDLQSEPARKLLEVCAYRELLLRQRVNDAARANLLAFAGTTDLDHLASFNGVTRLTDETDTALRLRVQQRIQGWSNAGGAAHYRYWALTADERVSDAAVSSPSAGIVRIAVLSAEGDGVSSEDLLTAVRAIVLRATPRARSCAINFLSSKCVTASTPPLPCLSRKDANSARSAPYARRVCGEQFRSCSRRRRNRSDRLLISSVMQHPPSYNR